MAKNDYVSWQGEVALAARDGSTGKPIGVPLFIGDANVVEIKGTTEKIEVRENITGRRTIGNQISTGTTLVGTVNFRRVDPANAALMLWGSEVSVATGAVVDEPGPDDVVDGDRLILARPGLVTLLTVKDSTPTTPLVLVSGTDYISDGYGVVQILNIGTFVQPFKFSYTVAAVEKVAAQTTDPPIRYMFVLGKNSAERGTDGSFRRARAEIKKVQFEMVDTFPFINEKDYASVALNFLVLKDEFTVETDTESAFWNQYWLD